MPAPLVWLFSDLITRGPTAANPHPLTFFPAATMMTTSMTRKIAFALLFIFSLNLLVEIQAGDCHEHENEISAAITTLNQSVSFADAASPCSSTGHTHFCHFGHCGHVLSLHEMVLPTRRPALKRWIPSAESVVTRDPSPPEKPPLI
jgi:hypothetical protein